VAVRGAPSSFWRLSRLIMRRRKNCDHFLSLDSFNENIRIYLVVVKISMQIYLLPEKKPPEGLKEVSLSCLIYLLCKGCKGRWQDAHGWV
jgi:hypothetical protein